MTYREMTERLARLYDTNEAKAIARWVLEVRFGLSMADVLCGQIEQLPLESQKELDTILQRLELSEPVQYVLGIADFYGRQYDVAPGVLIPRPETAELCRWILDNNQEGKYEILDVGTGSGCIAITLAAELPEAKVTAWDISEKALSIATANAQRNQVCVSFEKKDALHLSEEDTVQWDIIVSNPPYIKPDESDEMAKNVLDYEPETALFAPNEEPIIFYEHISNYAWHHLKQDGQLFFELNPLTAGDVKKHIEQLGFLSIEIGQDSFGKNRFLKAKKI